MEQNEEKKGFGAMPKEGAKKAAEWAHPPTLGFVVLFALRGV